MKRFRKVRIGSWYRVTAMAGLVMLLGGCFKDDNQVYEVAAVRALNAVPGSQQLDVFLDQNKFNFDNAIWEDEVFAYTDTLPYKNAWPGNRLVSIVDPDDYPNARPIVQKAVNLIPGKFYSLFVAGYDSLTVLYAEDNLTDPPAGRAKVRFVHLSPNAPALDIEVKAETGNPVRFDDQVFKEVTDFAALDGGVVYTVNFMDHNSDGVLQTFGFTPDTGMIYTVWVKGLIGNTGDTSLDFGHGIVIH